MGINHIYMIMGFGVELGEVWGDIGFLGGTLGFFNFFGRI